MNKPIKYDTIHEVKVIAQEKLNKDFAEYFPNHKPPKLTDGIVRAILEAYEKQENKS